MYGPADFRAMIRDEARTGAYARALERVVRPGCTVVDLGAGCGYFALLACRAGAGRVYAIERDPIAQLGVELARANGWGDRIQFVQGNSDSVELPRADVLVSDLRGMLPFFERHIPAIADARTRLLAPGGAQVGLRDRIWLALLADRVQAAPAPSADGIDLGPLERAISHTFAQRHVDPSELISEPVLWHTLEYATVTSPDADAEVRLVATRDACVRGIVGWFDAELASGIGFSTAPGRASNVYGHAIFPLPWPVPLAAGDVLRVRLRATLVGDEYVWSWEGGTEAHAGDERAFAQSTFHALPLAAERLRRRSDRFVPVLARAGQAKAWMLHHMTGATLGEIARGAAETFPDLFPDPAHALRWAADLSDELSE